MSRTPFCIVPVLFVLLGCATCPSAASAQAPTQQQGVEIKELLAQVQDGLLKAQKALDADNIPLLKSVTLDLVAEADVTGGGTVNLLIVSFGKKWEKDLSQEIEITLTPPSATTPLKVALGPSVSDQLVAAIVSAARGVQQARANKGLPLVATSLKVVISFVVKADTSGGAKFQIVPVTFDLSGNLANKATQKITILFQDPEPKKP
jgi:hypothetical protein